MGRVTIQMIADRAGVSRGTVDRVLHNRPNVNPEIRERVQQIVRKLRYSTEETAAVQSPKRIGVLLPGASWFSADLKREWLRGLSDAKRVVEPLGFGVELIECETDLPHEFAARIERMEKDGLDGLAISAKNNPVIRGLIDGLTGDGIPVVTYNSDIPDSGRLYFVGQDLYRSGKVAADLITKYVREPGEILLVAGNLEFDAHQQRVRGFMDKCMEAGIAAHRLHLTESFNEYVLTYDKVSDALTHMPNLRAIYMANESVPACAEAIRRSGRQDKIMVVGNDLSAATRRLLADGTVDFIIEQNMYWQGYQPVLLLKNQILSPEPPKSPFLFTDISVINAENMRETESYEGGQASVSKRKTRHSADRLDERRYAAARRSADL